MLSKLADWICYWELIDIYDLLPEVRLSDRESELEKLLLQGALLCHR